MIKQKVFHSNFKIMTKIPSFINSQARNKLVIHDKEVFGLEYLDVGRSLANKIKSITSDTRLGMKSINLIEEIFSDAKKESDLYGRYLAIYNLGILFENDLKIDFIHLLTKYSFTETLFVKWEGEIEDGILYFLTKEKGQKIDIKNLSHIVI